MPISDETTFIDAALLKGKKHKGAITVGGLGLGGSVTVLCLLANSLVLKPIAENESDLKKLRETQAKTQEEVIKIQAYLSAKSKQ